MVKAGGMTGVELLVLALSAGVSSVPLRGMLTLKTLKCSMQEANLDNPYAIIKNDLESIWLFLQHPRKWLSWGQAYQGARD